jgi:transposase InsO family protein
MPRKRWLTGISEYAIPKIDPNDRNAVEDDDLVRHALVDFDELAVLSDETREHLVKDLVDSIRFARGGVNARKRGVANDALAQQIFLSDIGRALKRAELPATRWRKKYDNGGGESFFFRLAREIAAVSGIALPQDLKLPGKQAAKHQYGTMSPAMKAAQKAELTALRKRPSKPRSRLKSVAP